MLWGYLAQALNIGAGLILLPVILKYLPAAEVGLWFVFITLVGLAQLLEFGFNPTISRNTSYIYAGAVALQRDGLPIHDTNKSTINLDLLASLLNTARKVYRVVSLLAAALLLIGGSIYISTLVTEETSDKTTLILAWVTFATGYIVTLYYGYINGMLHGRGDVSQSNKIIITTRGLLILLGSYALITGHGLLGLGIASLMSSGIGRIIAMRYFFSETRPEMRTIRSLATNTADDLTPLLWHNASRLGAVQVGSFLIQRGNILIASSTLGLESAASYGMTVTILTVLITVSSVLCQLQLPRLNAIQSRNERSSLITIYGQIQLSSWTVFSLGLIFLVVFGDLMLNFVGSDTKLIPWPLLLVFGLIYLFELNHSIAATYLTTVNKIPFVKAALISGISITVLAVFLSAAYGIVGLIAAQGVVQLAYNNWKWPMEAQKNLQSSFLGTIKVGFKQFIGKI